MSEDRPPHPTFQEIEQLTHGYNRHGLIFDELRRVEENIDRSLRNLRRQLLHAMTSSQQGGTTPEAEQVAIQEALIDLRRGLLRLQEVTDAMAEGRKLDWPR